MIPAFTVAVAGSAAVIILAAMFWRIRQLTKTLEDAKAVNRVMSGNWRDIPVYISERNEQLLCSAFTCPTQGRVAWRSRRLPLGDLVQDLHRHHRSYHWGDNR